jgi:hypothetical protein
VPQVTDGGSVAQPIVGFFSVALTPIGGGSSGATTSVVVQSGTVQEAVAEASKAIKYIPTAPDPGNLPSNAEVGVLYAFTSQPGTLYFYGPDGVWRALLAVAVV